MNPRTTEEPIQRKPGVLGVAAGLLLAVATVGATAGAAATAPRVAGDDLFRQYVEGQTHEERTMKKVLTLLTVCLLTAGCLIKTASHALYVETDGTVAHAG